MEASVAVVKLNRKCWFNCYTETRPWVCSLTSTDLFFDIKRVSFLWNELQIDSLPMGEECVKIKREHPTFVSNGAQAAVSQMPHGGTRRRFTGKSFAEKAKGANSSTTFSCASIGHGEVERAKCDTIKSSYTRSSALLMPPVRY